MTSAASPVSWFHGRYIHARRIDVLASHFAELIMPRAFVLDIGCGDGRLAAAIAKKRPDLRILGIDVLVRGETAIPVRPFDGKSIPSETDAFDVAMMVDVLHHTESPVSLMTEAVRVGSKQVVLKDHFVRGFAARRTLALMDHIGNARHGVEIPANYLTESQWNELYQETGLQVVECRRRLGLYPPPLSWAFERQLHFIASLRPISS